MKKKTQIIVLTVCTILIYSLGTTCWGANESGVDQAAPGSNKIDALEWGFKFASAIPVKPHVVDRGKSQYLILEVYLERDMPDEVAERASRIVDWHECLSYADLAVYFARKNSEKVSYYSERARACGDRLIDWETSWQRDRVLLRIAEARAIAGQIEAAERIEAELPAESAGRARTLRLSRMDGPGNYEKRINQLKSMENSQHMEVRRDVAQAYIAILIQLGTEVTVEQSATLRTRIYEVAETLPQLMQHEVLCSLSRAAFTASQKEMGRSVLEYAEQQLKKRELKARYDVKTLTALAVIWDQNTGDSLRAESLLHEAADLLANSNLKGTDGVTALTSLAQGYATHGNQDEAWKNFRLALQTAESQKNARPRAMALTEICAAIGHWGIPLLDDVAEEMKRLYEALGDPW